MRDTAVLRHYLEPLLPLLEPDDVTELVINRPGEAGIEDRQGWRWHDLPELDSEWLGTLAVAAASFTHQDIDGQTPICSTVLPGGELPDRDPVGDAERLPVLYDTQALDRNPADRPARTRWPL
jgi:type IV secretory pathway ATPase VirB11/archaellum biosynthesis ATPase